MSKGNENKNFHFTFDNYYNNIYTFLYLKNKNIEVRYIFSQKRKYFPKKIKELKLEKGESKLYNIKNTEIRLFFLKDKKQINLASNSYNAQKYKYKNKKCK